MTNEMSPGLVHPLLTNGATPTLAGEALPGSYDPLRHVWVVASAQGARPIVEAGVESGETGTATAVRTEQDDTDMSLAAFGDTSTGTKVQAETDDSDLNTGLLEIATKTMAQIESEDVDMTIEALGDFAEPSGFVLPIQ